MTVTDLRKHKRRAEYEAWLRNLPQNERAAHLMYNEGTRLAAEDFADMTDDTLKRMLKESDHSYVLGLAFKELEQRRMKASKK
jgi:hypothetical protein